MGRAADPRLTLRLSPAEWAILDAAARELGVETGGLSKLAVFRGLAGVVEDVGLGRVVLRARSGSRPRGVGAHGRRPVEPVVGAAVDAGVARAVAARRP